MGSPNSSTTSHYFKISGQQKIQSSFTETLMILKFISPTMTFPWKSRTLYTISYLQLDIHDTQKLLCPKFSPWYHFIHSFFCSLLNIDKWKPHSSSWSAQNPWLLSFLTLHTWTKSKTCFRLKYLVPLTTSHHLHYYFPRSRHRHLLSDLLQ